MFIVFALAGLGLPGTSGFLGEFLVLTGTFQKNYLVAMLATFGVVLGAAYMLWLTKRVIFGVTKNDQIKNIKDVKLDSLRSLMGIVTQETFLFDDSVKANIAYGLDSVSDDVIKKAAIAANADEFIEELPEGYDTIIGERGVKLSGGQRQRIAIARAIVKNPPILILDEATSSLDTESEKIVQDAIETLMHNRTVVVIAHRLSTVHNADKIIVLDKGLIVDTGTHQELINKDGIYKQLHNMQFKT